jgi:hypothetical protein
MRIESFIPHPIHLVNVISTTLETQSRRAISSISQRQSIPSHLLSNLSFSLTQPAIKNGITILTLSKLMPMVEAQQIVEDPDLSKWVQTIKIFIQAVTILGMVAGTSYYSYRQLAAIIENQRNQLPEDSFNYPEV